MSASFPTYGFEPARLAERLRERGLAAALLTSPENVFYTTGYTTLPSAGNPILYMLRNRLPYYALIDADGKVMLGCWGFSTEGVEFGADEIVRFNDFGGALAGLRELLEAHARRGPLAVESTCPRFVGDIATAAAGGAEPAACAGEIVARLRLFKSGHERQRLQRSVEIIEQTAAELFDAMYLGMSRLELMQEARTRLMRNGADGISHLTFSFARENPEFAIDEPLEPGSLVTLDLGAIVDGYCSDNRRYAYGGEPPPALLGLYERMVGIVDDVGAALRPGTTYAEASARALECFAASGIDLLARFTHVGHHIGLETEEEWIDDDADRVVEAGMVINIELYTHAETGEQIGDEETYVIEESGPRRISVLPREIRVVGARR